MSRFHIRMLAVSGVIALLLGVACGGSSNRNPAGPSGADTALIVNGPGAARTAGASVAADGDGTTVVSFPPRNEPFHFRQQLEAKYRDGLHRSPVATYVDIEGDIVWTQEYLRYRVNGCDHAQAVDRVMFQIDGFGILPVCGAAPDGVVSFPPRNEPFDFRLQLEAKYRDGLRRTAGQTYVDIEGDIVWTQEYIRYRVNACDHDVSIQKVFDQIDGKGVQPVCVVTPPASPSYWFAPAQQTIGAGAGDYTVRVRTRAQDIQWRTSREDYEETWLWITSGASGTGDGSVTYHVQSNYGNPSSRSTRLVVSGLSGLNAPGYLTVVQQAGSGSCTYQLTSPKTYNVPAAGGRYTIAATQTGGAPCTWTGDTDAAWIQFDDTPRDTGNIRIVVDVFANATGSDRQGTVRVRWPGPQVGENILFNQAK